MKILQIVVSLFLSITSIEQVVAQDKLMDTLTETFLSEGILLENLNVTIPWNTPPSDLEKYGRPRIEKLKRGSNFIWDSAHVLGGIVAKLTFTPYAGRNNYFLYVRGVVDTVNAEKFKTVITNNLGRPHKSKINKDGKVKYFRWYLKQQLSIWIYNTKEQPWVYNFTIQNVNTKKYNRL